MATLYSPPGLNERFIDYRPKLIKELIQLGFVMVNMTDILSSNLLNNNSIRGPLERVKKVATGHVLLKQVSYFFTLSNGPPMLLLFKRLLLRMSVMFTITNLGLTKCHRPT